MLGKFGFFATKIIPSALDCQPVAPRQGICDVIVLAWYVEDGKIIFLQPQPPSGQLGGRSFFQEKQIFVIRFDDESMRSEEHTSELQSLMRKSYAVFCLKIK